jgi:hypothetical protein
MVYFAEIISVMAVTRLKRKERVNKTVAKQRNASLVLHGKRVLVCFTLQRRIRDYS